MEEITKTGLRKLLEGRFQQDTITRLKEFPPPSEMKNLEGAAERIAAAVRAGKKITIVGDYDVDGVVASVVVSDFFDALEVPVQVVIPNRFTDGYGLSPSVAERIDGELVVTVDNGIAAVEAAALLKARGVELIVTDHHTCPPTLPDATFIVNPKQPGCPFPYKEICGATVAWYLVAALRSLLLPKYDLMASLDLVGLATLADVMPLKSMNRVLVRQGLEVFNKARRPAIRAIMEVTGKDRFTADDVAFQINPRLNAAGRLEEAGLAFAFLKAGTADEGVERFLELTRLNEERKTVERELAETAAAGVDPAKPVIVAWGEGWHEGVIGIVASRLVNRFKKPAVVISVEEGRAKGSGRSVGDVDLYALLDQCRAHLTGFGGHKGAAGVVLEPGKIPAFARALEEAAASLPPEQYLEKERAVGSIPFREVDLELVEILEAFEPYGEANPKPRFHIPRATARKAGRVGSDGAHLRLTLSQDRELEAIAFFEKTEVAAGDRLSCYCTVSRNSYRNVESVQLLVEEVKLFEEEEG